MKRFKKAMRLYLGRTKETHDTFSNYNIGAHKKDWIAEGGFDASFIASFYGDDFERVTGVRLEKGEVVRVRIVVEEA